MFSYMKYKALINDYKPAHWVHVRCYIRMFKATREDDTK